MTRNKTEEIIVKIKEKERKRDRKDKGYPIPYFTATN